MSLKKNTTINDVAAEAGVSVTTVSLVLSGKGRISPLTAARVNQAIETLGFVRNRSAAMLRGGGSGVIGLIVQDICQPFYAEMTAGLSETLEKNGKVLFLTQSGHRGQNIDRCFDSLVAQGVEGIVLGGGAENAAHLVDKAREQGMALICASRARSLDGVDAVRPDNQYAAKRATEYLIKRGHHCIAWLGGSSASLTRAERIGGYCATLLQYGLPFRSEWIVECGRHQRDVAAITEQLIHQYPTITAILCHNATVTLGCYFGLQHTGRTIGNGAVDSYYGQQMALVGFGDTPQAELTDPALTFISSSAREIGRSAATRILQRMAEPDAAVQNVILSPRLIERGSA
ncbi:Mal regulon transcriptional regulator MalI [Erwinia endophytica]|uniref:Mal regulon transcriptional regulator MalI n=1 Tax=Erwinia endophytica TaxID=1563158 RepID=UPI001265FB4E|nr:Mal regulon transcriptional regulator MalI [Erwinia endophytica]KAB8313562.1 Mal regulon transcriptional regulator MalI [Erwinia endophytica]